MSGKFAVAALMLERLRRETKDRIVIVSNYTQTLDLFATLCREKGVSFRPGHKRLLPWKDIHPKCLTVRNHLLCNSRRSTADLD
jgi:hypothetical protein